MQPGHDVLDVATGSGNVALLAAQQGANVTGLDITPELFEAARSRAAEAGVEIEWVEGDAEELPYEDKTFDRALGLRHDVRAAAGAGRRRAGARHEAGRRRGSRRMDARRNQRPDVPDSRVPCLRLRPS